MQVMYMFSHYEMTESQGYRRYSGEFSAKVTLEQKPQVKGELRVCFGK